MNHSNQLAIVDGNEVFTIDEQTELEKHIDHVIAAHKNNRREINRLVFESIVLSLNVRRLLRRPMMHRMNWQAKAFSAGSLAESQAAIKGFRIRSIAI